MPKESVRENHADLDMRGKVRNGHVRMKSFCRLHLPSQLRPVSITGFVHVRPPPLQQSPTQIIHLESVLQPSICRSPERLGCARSSIAAQTQLFRKATSPNDTLIIPCGGMGYPRNRRHRSRIRSVRHFGAWTMVTHHPNISWREPHPHLTLPYHLKHDRIDNFLRMYAHDIALADYLMQPCSTDLHSLDAIMQHLAWSSTLAGSHNDSS
ncbi:hypothetical protein SVAN01_00375 [Stagonosporopsis vannaccii]|nr:hypothetical protein SVAN01_00375 [Stagonosporopsis vannaccii]